MKTIVLYASRTGNTEKIAQAIAGALPENTPCLAIKNAPENLADYDLVFAGFWVDRGTACAEAREFFANLKNPRVALFMTLGANPASEHATGAMENAAALLPEGTQVLGKFISQGAIDPQVIAMMYKMFPVGSPHGQSPERDALHAEAAKHPDEQDLASARQFAAEILKKAEETA